MKSPLACAALLALASAPARAAVVYDFVTTSVSPYLAQFTTELPFRVVVSDAVYLRGSVSLTHSGCGGIEETCAKTGPWDQVGITDVTPLWGSGAVRLAFLPDGTLAGGISETGSGQDATLSGSGLDWSSSRYGTDRYSQCSIDAGPDSDCSFTGYFLSAGPFPVAEPAGAALLGAGVVGLALARSRRVRPG